MSKRKEINQTLRRVYSNEEVKARNAIFQEKRLEKGYSIRKLAELSGISASYISKLENGYSLPSVEIVQKLSSVLGMQVEYDVFSNKNISLYTLLTEFSYHIDDIRLNRAEQYVLADIVYDIWGIVKDDKDSIEVDFLKEQIQLLKQMKRLRDKKEEK